VVVESLVKDFQTDPRVGMVRLGHQALEVSFPSSGEACLAYQEEVPFSSLAEAYPSFLEVVDRTSQEEPDPFFSSEVSDLVLHNPLW